MTSAEQDRLQRVIDGLFAFVGLLTPDGVLAEVNRPPLDAAGLERQDVLDRPFVDSPWFANLPATQTTVANAIARAAEGQTVRTDLETRVGADRDRVITLDMTFNPIRETNGRITAIVVSGVDVTAHHTLEAQLRQAQKLESLGRLAAGIAHDFNNILTVIAGNAELLSIVTKDAPATVGYINEIRLAGERASALTRQLLAFSRRQVFEPKVIDLNGLVSDCVNMLQRLVGEDVGVVTELAPNLSAVHADPGHVLQVLMNLAVNGRDAMPAGGRFTIATSPAVFTTPPDWARADAYVLLRVSDTGSGMTSEVLAQVFDPFFTTKSAGKGTGLGLAVTRSIIGQNGGHIEVQSAPGEGTTFQIYLPATDQAIGEWETNAFARPRGSETVLFVEDDESIGKVARLALAEHGYTVLGAADGEDALRVIAAHQDVDLLITDVVMPAMSGRDLAERLLALRPGLRVLYTSGYTDEELVRRGITQSETAFLQKPYTPTALLSKVRDVLE